MVAIPKIATIDLDETFDLQATFKDALNVLIPDGSITNVVLTITDPDGAQTIETWTLATPGDITHPSTGVFAYRFRPTMSSVWWIDFTLTLNDADLSTYVQRGWILVESDPGSA